MLIQVHWLTAYPASLLNRDETGLAKRISFGGATRQRVSSQCQKRRWREAMEGKLEIPDGYRTRYFFSRVVKRRLAEAGVDHETAHELSFLLAKKLIKAKNGGDSLEKETLQMSQAVLFGEVEADYFVDLLLEAAKEKDPKEFLDEKMKPKNAKALIQDLRTGYTGAMFGRFVTSDILARTDSAVSVSHAITTHEIESELDYFTSVEDLAEGETGSAHNGDAELTSGVLYGYASIDVPLLVSNLTGCAREDWASQHTGDAEELLGTFIRTIIETSPGAKRGSTAPYSWPDFVMIEVSEDMLAINQATAFLDPTPVGTGLMRRSIDALEARFAAHETMSEHKTEKFRSVSPVYATNPSVPWSVTIEKVLGRVFQ